MAKPTHEDAVVMLNLMQWAAQADLNKASRFVWGDEYIEQYKEFIGKYPRGTKEFGYVSFVCGYFETIGALWKNDLFNQELHFDWILVTPSWERLKGYALGIREETGEEKMYEHFEALSAAQSKD